MDKIDDQIIRLTSQYRSIRYDACEQLRAAPNLPQEAVTALKQACGDSDPDVARAAYRALLAHKCWTDPIPIDGFMDKSLPGPLSKRGIMDKLDRPHFESSSPERFWLKLIHK